MSTTHVSWQTTPYEVCAGRPEPVGQLPIFAELPIIPVEAPESVPYADELARSLGGGLPSELGAVVAILALLWVGGWLFRSIHALGVALVGTLLAAAPFVFAGGLEMAEGRWSKGDHLGAVSVLKVVGPLYPSVSWVDLWDAGNPAKMLGEAVRVDGIRKALAAGDLRKAEALVPGSVNSREGRQAQAAALTSVAAAQLQQGNPARSRSLAAAAVESTRRDRLQSAERALTVAAFHLAAEHGRKGDLVAARRALDEVDSSFLPQKYGILVGFLALEESRKIFVEDPSRLDDSVEILEAGWKDARSVSQSPLSLACNLGVLFEAVALRESEAGDPSAAVTALRKARSFVEGSPATAELFPRVLWAEGFEALKAERGEAATTSLEEAREHWRKDSGDPKALRRHLVDAWTMRTVQEVELEKLDDALTSARRAYLYDRRSRETLETVSAVHLVRADAAFARGDFGAARTELGGVEGSLAPAASMRAGQARPAERLLRDLRGVKRWETLPTLTGVVPADLDGDHRADVMVIHGPGGPLGTAELGRGGRVSFTRPGAPDQVYLTVADTNRDGVYDEHVRYDEEHGSGVSVLELDGDFSPDLRLTYRGDRLVSEEALSGRVLLRIGSGVIKGQWDPWWAGAADPFIVVSQDGEWLMQTATQRNTQFPVFREGIVLDYRSGSPIRIDLWDEDLKYDDWIDYFVFDSLPRSGVFRMAKGNAALEIHVTPTKLPPGYRADFADRQANYNVFRDEGAHLPEVADLVASAHRVEADAEAMAVISRLVISELLAMGLFRRANLVEQTIAALALDVAIVGPMVEGGP